MSHLLTEFTATLWELAPRRLQKRKRAHGYAGAHIRNSNHRKREPQLLPPIAAAILILTALLTMAVLIAVGG